MQLFFHRILFSGLLAFIFNSNTLSSQLLIPEIPSSEDVRLDQELVAATEPIIEKKAKEKEKLSESLQKEIEKTCTAMLSAKNNKQSEAFAAKLQRLFDLKRQAED